MVAVGEGGAVPDEVYPRVLGFIANFVESFLLSPWCTGVACKLYCQYRVLSEHLVSMVLHVRHFGGSSTEHEGRHQSTV